jgi:hypothetical protein
MTMPYSKHLSIKPLFLFFALCSFNIGLMAQIKQEAIIPLAPEAAEFSKYSVHPVSMFSGTPQISIPIYEINTGKIKLPITLSYHASGIRVDQQATWVGLGMSLHCGGSTSRSVRSIPDEHDHGWMKSKTTVDDIEEVKEFYALASYVNNQQDLQADFFNYNFPGKSGKFIYSKVSAAFVPIEQEAIIIERIADPGNADNTYCITDDDGTRYFFGQKQTYRADNYTPSINDVYVDTWYLTKIISYDNTDTVTLNYETTPPPLSTLAGNPEQIVETHSHLYYRDPGDFRWTTGAVSKSSVAVHHSYVQLKEVIFNNGKVSFHANTRRRDFFGTALDDITVYSKNDHGDYKPVFQYGFNYDYFSAVNPKTLFDYRLKLLSFTKKDLAGNVEESYRFEYNSIPLPSRLSYARDFWGYFNGAPNGTGGGNSQEGENLLPNRVPPNAEFIDSYYSSNALYKQGTADRNPSDTQILAATLERVVYPAGGYTRFLFEPHRYKTSVQPIPIQKLSGSVLVTGKGRKKPVSDTQPLTWPQNAISNNIGKVRIKFSPSNNPGAFDVAQRLKIIDNTTGEARVWEHTGDQTKELSLEDSYAFNPGHSYSLYGLVDDESPAMVSMDVYADVLDESEGAVQKSGGGIRIKSITSYDANDKIQSVEEYTYKSADGEGLGIMLRRDIDMLNNYYRRTHKVIAGNCGTCSCMVSRDEIVYLSASVYPQITYEGTPVVYERVTKTQSSGGLPNGKTEFHYNVSTDRAMAYNAGSPGGQDIVDNTLQSGGQLLFEDYFSYDVARKSFTKVKRIAHGYAPFNIRGESAISLWQKVVYPDRTWVCISPTKEDFGYLRYALKLGAWRQSSITETDFDTQGHTFTKITTYGYDNPKHLLPTQIAVSDSENSTRTEKIQYPGDHTAGDLNKNVLDKLVAINRLKVPYLSAVYQGTTLLNLTRVTFDNTWSNNDRQVLVKRKEFFNKDAALTKSDFVEFKAYDSEGNPLAAMGKTGVSTAYLWDYNDRYPIAEIVGATAAEVAYTSFESNGTGNWKYSSTATYDDTSPTGRKCLQLGSLQKSGLDPATTYRLSYCFKAGATISVSGGKSTDISVTTLPNGWSVTTRKISGATSITINGSGYVDEVRLHPAKAQMITYTYDPLVGVTSITDANRATTYYRYDNLNRLKAVADHQGNILKTFRYHHKN